MQNKSKSILLELNFVALVLTCFAIVSIGVTAFRINIVIQEQSVEFEQRDKVLNEIIGLKHLLVEAESALRGYMLTGETAYPAQYRNALSSIEGVINKVGGGSTGIIGGSVVPAKFLLDLQEKLEEFEQALKLHDANDAENALKVLTSSTSKKLNNNITSSLTDYVIEEQSKISGVRQRQHSKRQQLFLWLVIVVALGVVVVFLASVFYYKKNREKLVFFRGVQEIARKYFINDEITVRSSSASDVMDHLVASFHNVTEYIKLLSEGDYTVKLQGVNPHEKQKDDNLVGALFNLRDKLRHISEADKRLEEEERQRNWQAKGRADFNEILRHSSSNLNMLGDEVLKFLVEFLGANQGGLFVFNDDNPNDLCLDMVAAYAYGRKKLLKKKVAYGEGLLGMCVFEREKIHMTHLPSDYIKITSGLGKATPSSLLIVPLVLDDQVQGVVELASFDTFTGSQIDFIETVAESIASTLSATKINARTQKLLQASKQQSDELAEQEEMMRSNMKVLLSTQEEASKKERILKSSLRAYEQLFVKCEMDINGRLINANKEFCNLFEFESSDVDSLEVDDFYIHNDTISFKQVWENILSGHSYKAIASIKTKNNRLLWVICSFSPLLDPNGDLLRILFLGTDVTAQKQYQEEARENAEQVMLLERQLVEHKNELEKRGQQYELQVNQFKKIEGALDRSFVKAELTVTGEITSVNVKFANLFKVAFNKINTLSVFDAIPKSEYLQFEQMWHNVCNGIQNTIVARFKYHNVDYLWLSATFTPILDEDKNVIKILLFGVDVTIEKQGMEGLKTTIRKLELQREEIRQTLEEYKLRELQSVQQLEKAHVEIKEMRKEHQKTQAASDELLSRLKNVEIEKVGVQRIEAKEQELNEAFEVWSNHLQLAKELKDQLQRQQIDSEVMQERFAEMEQELAHLKQYENKPEGENTGSAPTASEQKYQSWLSSLMRSVRRGN